MRARVCTDAVRGPLLEVVAGQRGSSVTAERIELVASGHVGSDLDLYIEVMRELVRVL